MTLLAPILGFCDTVTIPDGIYKSLLVKKTEKPEIIKSFYLDSTPVTNAQFFDFLQKSPQWQAEKIPRIFSEQQYLKHWGKNGGPSAEINNSPVIYVSWFAAQAFCKARHGRLPTTAEWEWASQAQQNNSAQQLDWYEKPTSAELPDVGLHAPNAFGVFDMHGLIWEWTLDFNASITDGESRSDGTLDNAYFCGGASARSADPSDYATFMRYAMRSSLSANYTLANLGFRCAYDDLTTPLK